MLYVVSILVRDLKWTDLLVTFVKKKPSLSIEFVDPKCNKEYSKRRLLIAFCVITDCNSKYPIGVF